MKYLLKTGKELDLSDDEERELYALLHEKYDWGRFIREIRFSWEQ